MSIDKNQNRVWPIRIVILLVAVVLILQLFNLQIVHDYQEAAENISFYRKTLYAPRGLIYDRNGELLVYNQQAFDVMITESEVRKADHEGHPIDTLALCQLLSISKENFIARMNDIKDKSKNVGYSALIPQRLITQLSPSDYASLQEMLYKFPGITVQSRTLREYNSHHAAHTLGYIGEVSSDIVNENPYYHPGDYIGISGIEKQYEEELRGHNGMEILLRDKHGRIQGSYDEGRHDHAPVPGKDLTLSIDIELQEFGEMLMQNKVGSIVAIEPKTGEVLALVSKPDYDPSILVGRQKAENYSKLLNDPHKPLLNRAIMTKYPPGSTFKTANALVFQQEGIITEHTAYPCSHGYHSGNFHLGCHGHASPLDLANSIANSCNSYYCYALRAMLDNKKYENIHEAFEVWKRDIVALGFGYRLGIDIPNENRGFIPNADFYDKVYGKNRWRSLSVVSISIGQGEVDATPLQLANLASIIANRGYYYKPHMVKAIGKGHIDTTYTKRRDVGIDEKYFAPVVQGMQWAVNGGGTGSTARVAQLDSIIICGKTGTAENPHGANHSWFICFAPKDDPKIALCVLVENSGYGATWSAPIASLMVEKYLKREISEARQGRVESISNAVILPPVKQKK